MSVTSLVTRWERHQVPLYLAALGAGAVAGLATQHIAPGFAHGAEQAIDPVLALLLYATFLGVPFGRLLGSLQDTRFMGAVLVVNFVAAPAVAWLLTRFVASDRALLIGALFVLLTPCIDYVVVFTGLARGAADRLLAAAPVLMVAQMLLLPVYLRWFAGSEAVSSFEPAPFVRAFLVLIVLPLAAAAVTQWVAARGGPSAARRAAAWQRIVAAAMVPLMCLTLAVVVASQIAGVGARLADLLCLVPVYLLFAVVMLVAGACIAKAAGLGVAERRAVAMSGATRNSLVILPLVLALPEAYDLAPLAVVTQTLVELLVMVACVRLVPLCIRGGGSR